MKKPDPSVPILNLRELGHEIDCGREILYGREIRYGLWELYPQACRAARREAALDQRTPRTQEWREWQISLADGAEIYLGDAEYRSGDEFASLIVRHVASGRILATVGIPADGLLGREGYETLWLP